MMTEFKRGIWTENPVLRLMLGLCPVLAATKSGVDYLPLNPKADLGGGEVAGCGINAKGAHDSRYGLQVGFHTPRSRLVIFVTFDPLAPITYKS